MGSRNLSGESVLQQQWRKNNFKMIAPGLQQSLFNTETGHVARS